MRYNAPKVFPSGFQQSPQVTLTDQFYRPIFQGLGGQSDGPSAETAQPDNSPAGIAAQANQSARNAAMGLTTAGIPSTPAGWGKTALGMMNPAVGIFNGLVSGISALNDRDIETALGNMTPEDRAQGFMGMGPEAIGNFMGPEYGDRGLGVGAPANELDYGGALGDQPGGGGSDGGNNTGAGSSDPNSGGPEGDGVGASTSWWKGGPIPNRGKPALEKKKITAHEGEFVINPKAVKKIGLPFLHILNGLK